MAPWGFLGVFPALATGSVSIPTKTIAAGVNMPVMSIGDGGQEKSQSSVITKTWLDLGGRGIDTATMYGNQKTVAASIAAAGVSRKDVFITTKVPGCSNTASYVEGNLRDLGTDYIDLMLIHFPWGDSCSKAWSVLEDYHANGTLKAIGVSNFARKNLDSIMKNAKVTPAVNQIQLNVLEHDADTIAASQAYNITLEAYSPLGRSGHSGDIPGNKVIQGIASSHNVSTYQVALKWILQHGHVLTFQSSSKAHQESDADVFGFTLADPEMTKLDGLQGNAEVIV